MVISLDLIFISGAHTQSQINTRAVSSVFSTPNSTFEHGQRTRAAVRTKISKYTAQDNIFYIFILVTLVTRSKENLIAQMLQI